MIASSETIEASAPSSGPQGMKPRLKSGLSSLGPLGRMMVAKDRAKETPHSEFWLLTPEFCRFVAKAILERVLGTFVPFTMIDA